MSKNSSMEIVYIDGVNNKITRANLNINSSKKKRERDSPSKLVINVAKAKILTARSSGKHIN